MQAAGSRQPPVARRQQLLPELPAPLVYYLLCLCLNPHTKPCTGESGVDKSDMQKLRESGVFGPMSFWVTEMRNLQEPVDMAQGGRVSSGAFGGQVVLEAS